MNYIKSLQQENEILKARIQAAQEAIQDFKSHLNGPKFIGTESGERKDWIATADVHAYLSNIQSDLRGMA